MEDSYNRSVFRYVFRLMGFCAVGIVIDLAFVPFAIRSHPMTLVARDHEKLLERKLFFREKLDVVIVGSSMTQSGVDPSVVDGNHSLKIWNAGIPARSNIWWQADLIEDLIRKNRPKHIIYPIETFSFGRDPNATDDEERSFLIPFLQSYKNRDGFKNWVKTSFQKRELQELPIFQTDQSRLPLARTLNSSEVTPILVPDTGWVNTFNMEANPSWILKPATKFEFSAQEKDRLARLLKNAERKGVRLSFLILPNFLNYGDAVMREKQEDAYDRLNVFLGDLVDECGYGETFDARFWLPEIVEDSKYWYDSVHLNGFGAAIFSPVMFEKFGYE